MGKFLEGPGDVFHILEIVQMIRVDIQYDFDARSEFQETVPVFAGFCDEKVPVTHVNVAVDLVQIAADQNRRLTIRVLEDQ